jgi:hypothetical protein
MNAIRLTIVVCLSLGLAGLLCYGAMRVAESIANASNQKIEQALNP